MERGGMQVPSRCCVQGLVATGTVSLCSGSGRNLTGSEVV